MRKSIATIAAVTSIICIAPLAPAQAGGGATSAPSKYDNASQHQWHSQNTSYTITEFSSSSTKARKIKR
jgi:hypothetical protein